MLIQVGELAKRAGITVRTLHHYEQTGLLLPSARSEAGYRLYNLRDVQRLHMIQALAKAGLELAEIRDFLEKESLSLAELLDAQITLLENRRAALRRCVTGWWICVPGLAQMRTPILSPGYRLWS
jgi:DNA-binding transcriptional MerR regulator